MSYRVEFSEGASLQVLAVQRWWRANRRAAPELFKQELRSAVQQQEDNPRGVPLASIERPGLRRMVLRKTRYHLCFIVDESSLRVRVLAVWHTARGNPPPLENR